MNEDLDSDLLPEVVPQAPFVVVDTAAEFHKALDTLIGGSGPLALDAERASGFRYSSRAYLVQAHRVGGPTFLIDPIGVGRLDALTSTLGDEEWIVHAAHQDLPCLRELGVEPQILFDTELGARLAGLSRVGLQGVVEDVLGLRLAKEHSAADWSTRPLPSEWLTYAALDVEVLPAVRDAIHAILVEAQKWDLAHEEFQAQLLPRQQSARQDPWRRLSGLHQLRTPAQLAIARELWRAREALAQETDTAPGRLVPDRALIAATLASPATKRDLAVLKEFTGRASRSHLDVWWEAIVTGRASDDLPPARVPSDGPPPPRVWADKKPDAWARLEGAKAFLASVSETTAIPVENLLLPDLLKRACWETPDLSQPTFDDWLRGHGARQWQIDLVGTGLLSVFVEARQSPGSSAQSDS